MSGFIEIFRTWGAKVLEQQKFLIFDEILRNLHAFPWLR